MLRSEDVGVHYESVGVIGNLVHSSHDIKRQVLAEGALQPVINLLSSSCAESQREAALLLGQFATTDNGARGRGARGQSACWGALWAFPPLPRVCAASGIGWQTLAWHLACGLTPRPLRKRGS